MKLKIFVLLLLCANFAFANEAEDGCLDALYGFSMEIPVSLEGEQDVEKIKLALSSAMTGMEKDSLLVTSILQQKLMDSSSYYLTLRQLSARVLDSLNGQFSLFERLDLKKDFSRIIGEKENNREENFDSKKIYLAALTAKTILFQHCQELGKTKSPFKMPEKISEIMLAFSSLMSIIALLTALWTFVKRRRKKAVS